MIVIPPKGLILAISIGAIAGPVFGIILFDIGVQEQLVYADGTSSVSYTHLTLPTILLV